MVSTASWLFPSHWIAAGHGTTWKVLTSQSRSKKSVSRRVGFSRDTEQRHCTWEFLVRAVDLRFHRIAAGFVSNTVWGRVSGFGYSAYTYVENLKQSLPFISSFRTLVCICRSVNSCITTSLLDVFSWEDIWFVLVPCVEEKLILVLSVDTMFRL